MGCCVSMGCESVQGGNNASTVQINQQNNVIEQLGPRLAAVQAEAHLLHPVSNHRTSRRHSRHLELESQREQEEGGLRLDERVTRPLVRHTWISRPQLTLEELARMRDEFYDTRVTGRREVWGVLRLAVETMENGDLATAQEIINAAGITIPTGNLIHNVYDETGARYELPEYCVSEPRNLVLSSPHIDKQPNGSDEEDDVEDLEEIERKRLDKGKRVIHANERTFQVVARLSDRGGPGADILVVFEQGEPLKYIIRSVMKQGRLDFKDYQVKIAYLGKILLEHETLPDQGWVEGHVVNALVLQKQ